MKERSNTSIKLVDRLIKAHKKYYGHYNDSCGCRSCNGLWESVLLDTDAQLRAKIKTFKS